MNIFKEIINKDDLCFDVGANIGRKTDSFLVLGAKVVCIEPQIECLKILKAKYQKNDRVFIVDKALSQDDGEKKIFIASESTISSMSEEFIKTVKGTRFKTHSWDNEVTCSTTTLDKLIYLYGIPKFCKIDVEGYEVEVLKGLSKPIPYISIEFTPELKHLSFECIEHVSKIADYKFNYSEGESLKFNFENWISKEEIIDFLSKNNDFAKSFGDVYMKL